LRQYGYPPDMQKLATDTVLKQADLWSWGGIGFKIKNYLLIIA
jgi:hypothetical protein